MAFPRSLADFLLSLPNLEQLSQRSHILLVSFYLRGIGQTHFSRTELSEAFTRGGLPASRNLDTRLRQLTKGKSAPLIPIEKGRYSLSVYGVQEIQRYLQSIPGIPSARASLENLVGRLADDAERRFLAEAIACVQVGAKRAAVVMVWLLAVDHMQRHILVKKLSEFNQTLAKRSDHKGLTIAAKDDFAEIRDERTFIEIMRSARIITNDVRKILDEKLGFRNTCAHPSDIEMHENKVAAAIEDLVDNLILKYPL